MLTLDKIRSSNFCSYERKERGIMCKENSTSKYIPKAGEVCETRCHTGQSWISTEIKYKGESLVIGIERGVESCYSLCATGREFRELKTEEEKFLEKYEAAAREWAEETSGLHTWRCYLYQSGFRYVGEDK